MALTVSFTIGTSSDPSAIIFTDTSTGTDAAVVGRKINFYDASSVIFGASPYDFPNFPGTTTLTINPLQADKALLAVMTWVNNAGVPLYTSSQIFAFVGYAKQFFSGLTRGQMSQPTIVNDPQYFNNKNKLNALIASALDAISNMGDIASAQNCILLYTPLIQQNSTLNF